MEINRQEKIINEISLLTLKKHRYNQTNDVNIRYFYGEKNPVFYKPVFYTCEREETSFVQVIRGKNLTLCSKSYNDYNFISATTDKNKDLSKKSP